MCFQSHGYQLSTVYFTRRPAPHRSRRETWLSGPGSFPGYYVSATNVLVIDDEEDMRELARFALELNGDYAVYTASSGGEGLALARVTPTDVILLDWMMPDMDGAETLRALKADPACARIPVIFLTGTAHDRPSADFIRLGARGAIAKPFNPLTLAEDLAGLMRVSEQSGA